MLAACHLLPSTEAWCHQKVPTQKMLSKFGVVGGRPDFFVSVAVSFYDKIGSWHGRPLHICLPWRESEVVLNHFAVSFDSTYISFIRN